MKAIGYVRVSTEEQAQEGVSLANQRQRIQAYAAFKGLELVDVIEDAGISGGVNKDRPGFIQVLDTIEAGTVDVLILYSLERLSRDMLTLLALERLLDEHDVELHTIEGAIVTDSPDGWMMFAMKAFLGEMERRQVKHRTKKAMQYKKAQGDVVGALPYGYTGDGGSLKPVASVQAVIERVNALYKSGAKLSQVVRALNNKGSATRNGAAWTPAQARKLIRDYRGSFKKHSTKTGTATRSFIEAIA